jgi:cellulose synthase/poly-beta-1,6-N-acetylglucosamine synthase-like glycosyltransferase
MDFSHFSQISFYFFSFLALYAQVFFLVTFFERRKDILVRTEPITLKRYPSVTVIVPCYNEEATIYKTVRSLLALDYPKNKLNIILIDDGSKDRTWETIQRFSKYPNISAYKKENGGKHTAMNFGIERTTTELVGGLDADSFVDSQALKRIVTYFTDKTVMAVAPSIVVSEPKTLIQKAQKAEYDMAIYTKKMLGFLGGIHVTPGPFSIFRKKVFDELGPFRKAHNTEDQEIALRMQEHGYRIEHCVDAYVYTVSPNTVGKLYRQRLRWVYGFIKNAFDYRRLLFKRKYGNIGLFTLPSGIISVSAAVFMFGFLVYNVFSFIKEKVSLARVVGIENVISTTQKHFDWFFVNTQALIFISILIYVSVITSLVLGRRMIEGKVKLRLDILYFIFIFSIIAPFWLLKAIWNAIRSKESSWTFERRVIAKK